jgi:hypothetical protein
VQRLALLVVVCAAAFFAAGTAQARSSCWEQVISDWSTHNAVRGSYPPGCYRTAIDKLPEDLRTYSSAPDDIRRALQTRLTKVAAAAPQTKAEGGTGGSSNLLLFAAVLVAVVALAVVAIR